MCAGVEQCLVKTERGKTERSKTERGKTETLSRFVHIEASIGRGKVNQIIREMNGHELNGNKIRVQLSTSGVRQRPGMGGDQCYRSVSGRRRAGTCDFFM